MLRLIPSICQMPELGADLRLVIFDVDGTLVDSQTEIMGAMAASFASENIVLPAQPVILSIVGLSLAEAFARLLPDTDAPRRTRMVQAYKDAFNHLRGPDQAEMSPLYPGALDTLHLLRAQPDTLLAVATGKSRRGLDKMIERHDLAGFFASRQTADDHPSKPHPAMIHAALAESGVGADRAVMIGDTTYDIDMGRAAGVKAIGVGWGYHAAADLNADALIDSFGDLPATIDKVLG